MNAGVELRAEAGVDAGVGFRALKHDSGIIQRREFESALIAGDSSITDSWHDRGKNDGYAVVLNKDTILLKNYIKRNHTCFVKFSNLRINWPSGVTS